MKALKPSHREKKRYLLLSGVLEKEVDDAILKYIGTKGYAKASPQIVKKNILAINRGSLDDVRAALLLSKKNISVKKVSGSISKLK